MMEGNKAMPCLNLADFPKLDSALAGFPALEPATGPAQIERVKGMAVEEAWISHSLSQQVI